MNVSDLSREQHDYLASMLDPLREAEKRVRSMGVGVLNPEWTRLQKGLRDTIEALESLTAELRAMRRPGSR